MIRLDKMLSHTGYGSRKEVKNLVRKGHVKINGKVVKNDDVKVDETKDIVLVYEDVVSYVKEVYLMLNKPKDYISATVDNYHQTVIDLVSEYSYLDIFPVGRLDIDTEGLLIITNDGKLSHKLLSPKRHVYKTYYVEFAGEFLDKYHETLKEGVVLDDDYKCLEASFEQLSDNSGYIKIREGKFHQVKRMFIAMNMKVTYLKRVAFGPLKLDESLNLGEYRHLSNEELELLKKEVNFSE